MSDGRGPGFDPASSRPKGSSGMAESVARPSESKMSDGRRRPSAAMVGTMRDSTVLARGLRARAAWLKPSSRPSESKMSDGRRRPSAAMVGTMRDSTVLARGRRARAAWLKPSSRLSESKMSDGRDDWIRTSDPLTPSQVRYQAAPRPEPCPGGQKGNSTTTPGRRLRLSRGGSPGGGSRPSAPRVRPALRGGNRPTAPPLPVPARATTGRAPSAGRRGRARDAP